MFDNLVSYLSASALHPIGNETDICPKSALFFEATDLRNFLMSFYSEDQVSQGSTFEITPIVKRQLVTFTLKMDQEGMHQFLSIKEIHRFFGTSNRKVLVNIYRSILAPIASAVKQVLMEGAFKELSDSQISSILEDLPIKPGKLNNAADRLEYIFSGIINTMIGRTIFFRQLLQGARTLNIFEHPHLLDDFSKIGIASLRGIDLATYEHIRKRFGTSINKKHLDCIILAYSYGIRYRKSATLSQIKQGTDLLVKFDLTEIERILEFVQEQSNLTTKEYSAVKSVLLAEKEPRRTIMVEMKTAEGYPRNILKNLYDLHSFTGHGFGIDFLDSLPYDLKGTLDHWNYDIPSLKLEVNYPEKYLDFTPISGKEADHFGFPSLSQLKENRSLLSVLSQEFRKRIPDGFLETHLLPFLETLYSTTAIAIIEEWLRSGSVIRINPTGFVKKGETTYFEANEVRIEVTSTDANQCWIVLKRDKPPLRIENNKLVFGPDLVDCNGNIIADNPFKFSGQELENFLEQAQKKLKKKITKIKKGYPGKAILPSDQVFELESFIQKMGDLEEIQSPEELPFGIRNLLVHQLKELLFRNRSFGLKEVHIKSVKGYGNRHFCNVMSFLAENKLISPDTYDEFILTLNSSPNVRPKNNIPIGTEEIYAFAELLPPDAKSALEIDQWTFKDKGQPIMRRNKLQPSQINEIADTDPKTLQIAANIDPEYGPLYFRKPVGLKSVYFPTKRIHLNSKIVTFTGSLFDLTRFSIVPTDATLQDIATKWTNHTLVGTNAKDSFVKALIEAVGHQETHNAAMELVYFGDTKTAIGAFLAPLFYLLDTPSKLKVTTIANKRAIEITQKLKNGILVRTCKRGKLEVSSTQYKKFRKFKVNHQNALLWYIDAIMDNPSLETKLRIKEEPDVLAALTFDPSRIANAGTPFRITEIVIVKKLKQGPTHAKKLLLLQKGIITYQLMLLKNARSISKQNIQQVRTAFTKLRTSKDKPYRFSEKTLQVAPKMITPSNVIKAPSGQLISFTKKFTPYYFAFDKNYPRKGGIKLPNTTADEILAALFLDKKELQKHLNFPLEDFLKEIRKLTDQQEIRNYCQLALSTKKKHK